MEGQRNGSHWPFKKIKKLLSNEHGLSLIEMLIAVSLAAFISGVIYSLFITGLSLYQKIHSEGQLREDADYIATMIMNELTTNQPKFVTSFNEEEKKGITLHIADEKTVEGFIIYDSNDSIDNPYDEIDIYFNNQHFTIENKNTGELISLELSNSSFIDLNIGTPEEKGSGITLDTNGECTISSSESTCTHSTIHVTMVIENTIHTKGFFVSTDPLVLESSFGF